MNDTSAGTLSVISTRLPYTDRRALSEAWFSALHLASDGPLPTAPPERRGVEAFEPRPHGETTALERARRDATAPPVARSTSARSARSIPNAAGTVVADRVRAARASFSKARSYAPFRTSLTLGVDGERVALLLRREGATLHVVALCRPAIAETVRRALACADLHLRAQGETVRARVETIAGGAA